MKLTLLLLAAFAISVTGPVEASAETRRDGVATRTVDVRYTPPEQQRAAPIFDTLATETVLTVRAVGFEADAVGVIRQCVADISCTNLLPVRSDGDGAAVFQFLVSNRFAPSSDCRLGSPPCTIELRIGETVQRIDTIFVDVAPALGRLEMEPHKGLVSGQLVEITAAGFPPSTDLTAMICAWPATSGSRCGAPGLEVELTTDATGFARARVPLDVAAVGEDRVACGRRVRCELVLANDEVTVRALPVRMAFAGRPGASYSAGRLAAGLGIAVTLAVFAAWRVMSTDWRPPTEADAAAASIDNAAFADLDREAAEFVDLLER